VNAIGLLLNVKPNGAADRFATGTLNQLLHADAGNRQMVFRYEADTTLAALKDVDVWFIMDVR